MKAIIIFTACILLLSGCSQRILVCNCCGNTYKLISNAKDCISNNRDTTTTSDNRLFLIAIHNFEESENKALDWNIIADKEIQNTAKRNYLLIFQHRDSIRMLEDATELTQTLEEHTPDSLFFIIANQVFYPFGTWDFSTPKERIIDMLEIGDGP